jgi:hypothetical protein
VLGKVRGAPCLGEPLREIGGKLLINLVDGHGVRI